MAIAIGSTPTSYAVTLKHQDVDSEEVTKTFLLDGAVDIADIVTFLGHYEAITNARFTRSKLVAEFDITGMRNSALNADRPTVSQFLGLTFTKTDPVNALKTAVRGFLVPAYISAKVKGSGDSINVADTDLAAVIAFLSANLQLIGYDGAAYPGSFTYQNSESGFGSGARRIDGFPG